MNTQKPTRRVLSRILSLVMALAMVCSLFAIRISAAKADFTAPTKATTVDKNYITVSAHSQAFLLPEIIGLSNTTSRNTELPDVFAKNADDTQTTMSLKEAQKTAILGVFGSPINEEPNPYMYNYFYNAYATENDLDLAPVGEYTMSTGIGNMFSPANAANTGGITDETGNTVPVSIYLKQDILLGCNPRTEDGKTGYTDVIAAYNASHNDNYAPYEIDYEMSHVYSFLQNLYAMSDVAEEINRKNGKTWRYTDPLVISGDVEKFVKGLEAYVVKQMKKDNVTPEVVAVIDTGYTTARRADGTIKANEWVVNTKDCSTQQTTSYSRVAEFVADTTTNIVDALGLTENDIYHGEVARGMPNDYYVVTSDDIAKNAGLVLFSDVTAATTEEAGNTKISTFKQDVVDTLADKSLKTKVDKLEMMSSAFDCVGSIGANSVENLLGMAYFTAYVYPQYLDQFAVAAYWYNNFYHIANLPKLKSTMASNFATSSVRNGYDSRSAKNLNYDKEAVEALCIEGMNYYENHKDEFAGKLLNQDGRTGENTGWAIDWDNGIGAGQRQEEPTPVDPTPVNPTPAVKQNGLADSADSNGDWWFYKDGKIDTTHNGVDQNKYGWWRVENGKVNFNAQSIYQNQFGWWKTTNGKVTFKEEGVFQNGFGWWRVKDSKVDFNAQSIYQNKFGWWKTTNGKVTFKENGLFSNQYGTWKVENSKVNFNFNGKYQGKTIKNGKVV